MEHTDITVCDCHCWPTVQEMHDYVEALEQERDRLKAALPKGEVRTCWVVQRVLPNAVYYNTGREWFDASAACKELKRYQKSFSYQKFRLVKRTITDEEREPCQDSISDTVK